MELDLERFAVPGQRLEREVDVALRRIVVPAHHPAHAREIAERQQRRGDAGGERVGLLAERGLLVAVERHQRERGGVVLPDQDRERARAVEEAELLELAAHALGLARRCLLVGEEAAEARRGEQPCPRARIVGPRRPSAPATRRWSRSASSTRPLPAAAAARRSQPSASLGPGVQSSPPCAGAAHEAVSASVRYCRYAAGYQPWRRYTSPRAGASRRSADRTPRSPSRCGWRRPGSRSTRARRRARARAPGS